MRPRSPTPTAPLFYCIHPFCLHFRLLIPYNQIENRQKENEFNLIRSDFSCDKKREQAANAALDPKSNGPHWVWSFNNILSGIFPLKKDSSGQSYLLARLIFLKIKKSNRFVVTNFFYGMTRGGSDLPPLIVDRLSLTGQLVYHYFILVYGTLLKVKKRKLKKGEPYRRTNVQFEFLL